MLYAIKHALRGLSRRKLKNLINMIGILIGVSLLAGVQISTDSLVNAMKETVSLRYGDVDIVVQKGEYVPEFFNYSIFQQLRVDWELYQYIDGIAPRITTDVIITSVFTTKQTEPLVTALGIDPYWDKPFGNLIPDDTYGNNDFDFSKFEEGECVIGSLLAESVIDFRIVGEGNNEQLFLPLVAPIEMTYLDNQGNIRFETLRVKGIVKPEGKGVLNSGYTIFMKLNHLQALYNTTTTQINTIIISTTEGNDNAIFVKNLVQERLEFHFGEEESIEYQIDPQKYEAFEDIEDSIRSFRIILYVFGSLIIISGVMLILNITLMNIDERQRSIGIMRAIGMSRKQLLTTLITESLILGGFGSLLGLGGGILSGLGIIGLLENFLNIGEILTNIPLIIQPIGLIIAFVAGLIISLGAAIYPAWKASKIDIVDTINEVETIQTKRRSGMWSILLGGTLILSGIGSFIISLSITPEWRWMVFVGSILGFLFGLGFVFARIIGPRISFNLFALSWMTTGLLSVLLLNPYLTKIGLDQEMALYTFLISMLALVFGTIIFVALNLEWISNRFNEFFQRFKRLRAMGIISMRYVGKKKTRSALTFAIFGVILTMNVFLSVFTGSFTLGFDDFAEIEEGGVNIIAYSPYGYIEFEDDPIDIIMDADPNIKEVVGVKFVFSLTGAYTNLRFSASNDTYSSSEILPIPSDMWGVNDEFINLTEYNFYDVWDEIEVDPWSAVSNSSNNYAILPALLREFEFSQAGLTYTLDLELGEMVTISKVNLLTSDIITVNYTVIAFVETTSYSMLFSSFLFTSENAQIFSDIPNYNAFLIKTDPKLSTEENILISRNIERELSGFDTICLRDRLESFMELVVQTISFMQAFVSLGLVVGVLGLIVVSLRGITERTREIGMMRALGFKRVEVITAVVVEIFAVALVGLVIGLVNGFILGKGMHGQYLGDFGFKFIVPWAMLGLFTAITIALSIIAAVLPARRASKIPPSEALRYTG
ncbi:MAG: FtsX-like permease family protein [Candidatus Heimdallarchaeota archaeon]|nr:FtsX-like permease family protein [Candidatus Heimdallarchaeota archaeon]